jgi:protein TonB
MSGRLAIAVSVSGALHLAVAAALIAVPTRPLEEPPARGIGIEVVFSAGGGGEQVGEVVPDARLAEPAEPALPDVADAPPPEPLPEPLPAPPPAQSAALPLPPPAPPRPPPVPPGTGSRISASAGAGPQSAVAPTAGLLDAAIPTSIGRKVDPVVPREARLNRWQGTVLLAVTVSPEGVPSLVELLRSTGYPLLDRAAIEAMWQWRFDPARRGGVPVEERVAIPITFRIVD